MEQDDKISLSNPLWHTRPRQAKRRMKMETHHMMGQGGALSAPYIWHVKDQEPLETKRSVQQHWATPYFLNDSTLNAVAARESFEFWFSLVGGGTMAHADAYCEMTISMQLRGAKCVCNRTPSRAHPPSLSFAKHCL